MRNTGRGGYRPGRVVRMVAMWESAVPADRRLRLPLGLRVDGTGRPQRQRRVALPPDGWTVRACSARSSTGTPAGSASRPADMTTPAARRYLPGTMVLETSWGTPTGLDHRARPPAHRAVAPRARPVPHPPAGPHRLRRRPRPAAHGPLRERRGAGRARVRADVRLRPAARELGPHRPHLPPVPHQARPRRAGAHPHQRHAHRVRGRQGGGPHPAEGGRPPLLRALVDRARPADGLRGGLRPADLDRPPLAALAGPGPLPGPPVAGAPRAQRAHAEGADLRAHGRAPGGAHHRRSPRRRAASGTGTTATPGSATRCSRSGRCTRSASTGRPTTSSGSSPTSPSATTSSRSCTGPTAAATSTRRRSTT